MSLTLYFHPLSSFCHKALIALYDSDIAFTPKITNLGDPDERGALIKLWPIGKFPVLRDDARNETVPEATIIIEYLAEHQPQAKHLIPADAAAAYRTRLADRFYFWRYPIARFVEDATALAIEVPSAEILAASQNPALWTQTAQRQRAARLRQTYGVRTLGSRERQALQAERRRRKGHGVIQLTR